MNDLAKEDKVSASREATQISFALFFDFYFKMKIVWRPFQNLIFCAIREVLTCLHIIMFYKFCSEDTTYFKFRGDSFLCISL